jgi:hypothetical protein
MTFDLLNAVQPEEGWFCVVGIKGKSVIQRLVRTREELDEYAERFVADERNAFFAVAKFLTDADRTKDNVQSLKAFWLDIDCGPTKAQINKTTGRPDGYATQKEGLQALQGFCKLVGLPKPTLINSGRGLHVYWRLTEAVSRDEWEPVAARLRELCFTHELYVDSGVFEVSRVLRIPGTYNFKDDPPTPVTVMTEANPVEFNELRELFGVEDTPEQVSWEATALRQPLFEATYNNFRKIMNRSAEGNGCQQLLDCWKERASLAEPRWFAALSIAKFCRDSDSALHKMSEGHPDYDPSAVEYKIKHILGPHTCGEFEKHNPGGCKGCTFKGKIKSPIVLGKEVERATEEDNHIEMEEDGVKEIYQIPEYPFPFFRGKGGGVWWQPPASEEAEPIQVYEHDIYVLKRMVDPDEKVGDVAVIKFHTPLDGVKEFIVPNMDLTVPAEVKKLLASYGVLCSNDKKSLLLSQYIIASVRELQTRRKAEKMRSAFGWADNDSKYVIGDREITPDGIFHSPPSNMTSQFAEHMQKAGTFDKWKEIFNIFGREGLEPQAFAILSTFGSSLFKYTGQQGALISLVTEGSGTGKSTSLYLQNSVWGSPVELTGIAADTTNAKFMRLGIHKNLPVTFDELTEAPAEEVSRLAYGISQGKWKDRMASQANALRKNLTNWCTIVTTSSNSSMYEKLASVKNRPDGEMMRILEYRVKTNSELEADLELKYMLDTELKQNYGHAGEIYAEELVKNLEQWKAKLREWHEKVDRDCKIAQKERFWSAVIAANMTGGYIARRLGLIDWDLARIYKWATMVMLPELREEVSAPVDNTVAVIGDFINRGVQHTLVVNDKIDARSNMPSVPIMEPRGKLYIRYEPDTKLMYISAKEFKEDCVKYRTNYKQTLKELTKKGILIDTTNKRMSKGMKINSPPTRALVLDCTNSEFFDVDNMLAVEEPQDAGGEG